MVLGEQLLKSLHVSDGRGLSVLANTGPENASKGGLNVNHLFGVRATAGRNLDGACE